MKKHDNIYAKALNKVDDFKFDESVVDVFPDMIQRSVPGYETIVHTIGELAKIAVTPNTVVYDLGCSLGAASLSVARALPNDTCEIIGVDAYGSALKKFHETGEFDESEIYPYRIEGMGKNLIPMSTDFNVIDHYEKVTDEESAHCSRDIATKEGLFVGYTSGACLQALKQLNKKNVFEKNSFVVSIFCDHGSRYMSKIYSDKWMYDQGFYDSEKSELEKPIEYIK